MSWAMEPARMDSGWETEQAWDLRKVLDHTELDLEWACPWASELAAAIPPLELVLVAATERCLEP